MPLIMDQDGKANAADAGAGPTLNNHSAKAENGPSLWDVCLGLKSKVDTFLAEEPATPLLGRVQEQLRLSIQIVDDAFQRYRLEQISLAYNGGKDCLVLLLVVLACLPRRLALAAKAGGANDKLANDSGVTPPLPETFRAVYIVSRHPFPEVDEFVSSSSAEYHLSITRYNAPMRVALESYRDQNPDIKAVFMGTRRTDPHSESLKHFDPTDAGWPDFMRVHPVIDWHYAEIWAFIRRMGIPYCPLYDQGYTSLGGKLNTHPNPRLKKEGMDGFRPAYELLEDDEERLGRDAR